jgi:hypothetical protein
MRMVEHRLRAASAYGDTGGVPAAGRWDGSRLRATVALHPVEFAHQLGALVERVAHHQAFPDEACPKEGDRKGDHRQTLSRDSCDWHPAVPPAV